MKPIEMMIEQNVKPVEYPPGTVHQPREKYLTHRGELDIGGIKSECGILNTGERIFLRKAVEELITGAKGLN